MSRGRPVVAADAAALPEVVGDGGRAARPATTSTAGPTAMLRLLDDGDERERAGRAPARRRAAGVHAGRPSTRRRRRSAPTVEVADAAGRRRRATTDASRTVNLLVLCPHFAPDVAPTGEVMTSIADRARRTGATSCTSSPRCPGTEHHASSRAGTGRLVRHEDTDWGRITRVHPFPTDKRNIPARAAGLRRLHRCWPALVALGAGVRARRRARHVAAADARARPAGLAARRWRVPFVFNIQDVFPDVAVELGRHHQPVGDRGGVVARALDATGAPTPSPCCPTTCATTSSAKIARHGARRPTTAVRVIPNFVDTERIRPADPRRTPTGGEYGLDGQAVVMYAGNVGFSQSLDLVLDAAAHAGRRARRGVRGQRRRVGPARPRAAGRGPRQRALRRHAAQGAAARGAGRRRRPRGAAARGLARSSVPSKTVLDPGRRPARLASVDAGTEVARMVEQAGAGPGGAARRPRGVHRRPSAALLDDPGRGRAMGAAGRRVRRGLGVAGGGGRPLRGAVRRARRAPASRRPFGDRVPRSSLQPYG